MRLTLVTALTLYHTLQSTFAKPVPSKIEAVSVWNKPASQWFDMLTPFGLKEGKDYSKKSDKGDKKKKKKESKDAKPVEYHWYTGDGTVAAGWPDEDDWKSFDDLWDINSAAYISLTPNTPDETSDLHASILSVSSSTGVDARFILATIIQESNGNVRVGTTAMANANPGLMQSYGPLCSGTCKDIPTTTHCPSSMIEQMIKDGTASNSAGMGLQDLIAKSGVDDVSKYYKATRMYNSGPNSIPEDGDLSAESGAATRTYASDVANRLVGWVANGTEGQKVW
ncbi:unnamed protein product [Cercospora beticola]|nr:unnamed protein product [Cercospora beticola]